MPGLLSVLMESGCLIYQAEIEKPTLSDIYQKLHMHQKDGEIRFADEHEKEITYEDRESTRQAQPEAAPAGQPSEYTDRNDTTEAAGEPGALPGEFTEEFLPQRDGAETED